jgi:predicted Zn-dependent protease
MNKQQTKIQYRYLAMGYSLIVFLAIMLVGTLLSLPSQAMTIIRDSEIEKSLKMWSEGVIEAAGLQSSQVNLVLIQSPDVNAFVAGGANIFIYTGLIDKSENVGEVIGVIAHELGHIAGGHLTRTAEVGKNASFEAMLGAIVGIGAAIATGDSSAAAAGITIGQGQAQNSFLSYSRIQESTADQAGLRYMTDAGLNPEGLPSFLEKLSSQELLPLSQQSQYVRTHPLTRDRIEALEHRVETSPLRGKSKPDNWQSSYLRVKAKLSGFTVPQQVALRYPPSNQSVEAQYARAIAAYRSNQFQSALTKIDALIVQEPKNPFFHELKGQILFDNGRASESIAPYEKALDLMPEAGLIRLGLARSLIESSGKNTDRLNQAINHLKRVEKDEPRVVSTKRLLATAYGRLGREAEARVFLAEENLMRGRKKEALDMARVTLSRLKPNSPEALRAQDIINSVGEVGKKD